MSKKGSRPKVFRRTNSYKKSSPRTQTSWEGVSDWYKENVGEQGHFYHRTVVIPGAIKLLNLKSQDKLLDLACGQGVLERAIPVETKYVGIDISKSLVEAARSQAKLNSQFYVSDVSRKLPVNEKDFTHASIILALQNIENFNGVIENAATHLKDKGRFLVVINHPYFRIPKHTDWQTDYKSFVQYRRVFRYSTPFKIEINMSPSKGQKGDKTLSFHRSLADYSAALSQKGFVIEKIEEWHSNKKSQGKMAKVEDRAREEFPMFMAILARKS